MKTTVVVREEGDSLPNKYRQTFVVPSSDLIRALLLVGDACILPIRFVSPKKPVADTRTRCTTSG
jgi:hypothetical protein